MTPLKSNQSPPRQQAKPQQWLRQNLFNGWGNTVLTLLCLGVLLVLGAQIIIWVTTVAQWQVVQQNLPRFLVGRYPAAQSWRLWLVVLLTLGIVGILGLKLWPHKPTQAAQARWLSGSLYVLPVMLLAIFWFLGGGLGLAPVPTSFWNGLLLTLLVAFTSIVLSFPLGVLLALGRQSKLPILRGLATGYIELVRGLPLVGILFMAMVMLPLVLPGEWRLDRLLRAIAGLVLFSAAYLAENVRGGLQSIPRGQSEAAKALGLNPALTLLLVVLPQALQIATPAIVGQFISLFKDTALLSLFALLELTGMARSVLAQPQFIGRYAEVYLFIGLVYWLFCFTMSQLSQRLERRG
jgi:general L-amino acid transport system permease protein